MNLDVNNNNESPLLILKACKTSFIYNYVSVSHRIDSLGITESAFKYYPVTYKTELHRYLQLNLPL